MKKNFTSQSAFLGARVLSGLVIVLTGVFLALVGFGQNRWDNAPARSGGLQSAEIQSPDVTPTPTPTATPFMTFTVTSTADTDGTVCGVTCTLRQAINASNGNPPPPNTTNLIAFNILGGGVHTISPVTTLQTITQPVVIDGYTQPGSSANTNPPTIGINAVILIELSGAMAGSNFSGLTPHVDNCTVRGLVINSFSGNGIDLLFSNRTVITGNFIGTNPAGTAAMPNGSQAQGGVIFIGGPQNNTIGGTTPDARNLISGNIGEGVNINLGTGNMVQGNLIGTDKTGTLALGNTDRGVLTTGSNNLIGGTTVDARNIISGNNRGVDLFAGSNNTVQGNFIGTDITGTVALSNPNVGVNINGTSINLIGGLTGTPGTPPGNLISGNGGNYGVIVGGASASGNVIQATSSGPTSQGHNPWAIWAAS